MSNRVGEPFEYPHQNDDGYIVDQSRVKGADQTVANIAERDNIFTAVRVEGMQVRVLDSDGTGKEKTYQLGSGLTNSDWSEVVQSGGSGGGGSSDVEYFRDLKDLTDTPRQFQGNFSGRTPLARLKHGIADPVNTPNAIEYVTAPDLSVYIQPVVKLFIYNKGYGGAGCSYHSVDSGLRVEPTDAQPTVIYMNQEGIGDPSTAANDEAKNSRINKNSSLVFRAARRAGSPVWQRYRITFKGLNGVGAQVTVSNIQDFYSLEVGSSNYKPYIFDIPEHPTLGSVVFLHSIEISKVTGDSKSTNSVGLIVQSAAIKANAFSMGEFSLEEIRNLRDLNLEQRGAFKADIVVMSTDANYDVSGSDSKIFFVTKSNYGKITGLTAKHQQDMGDAGLLKADGVNGRWEVLLGEVGLINALIAEGGRANIYHYRGREDLKVLAPRKLDGLEDTDTISISDPDNFSTLKYFHNPNGAGGRWGAATSPFDTYTRYAASFEDGDHVGKRVAVVAGTQSGAGSPSYQGRSYLLDVRKDTTVTTYFDINKRDIPLYNPDFPMTLGVWLKGVSGGEAFKYNVKVVGKDNSGNAIQQDIVIGGVLGSRPSWTNMVLNTSIKSINNLVWTDASTGSSDADVSRYGRLIMAGIFNPTIVRTMAGIELDDPGEY